MSDDDFNQRNPLSSSSSNVSGTQALSVTIEPEKTKEDPKNPAEQSAEEQQAAAENINTIEHPAANQNEPSAIQEDVVPFDEAEQAVPYDVGLDMVPELEQTEVEHIAGEPDHGVAPMGEMIFTASESDNDEAHAPTQFDEPPIGSAADQIHEDKTTEQLRDAVLETMRENETTGERAFVMFEQMSRNLKVAMEDAGSDAARISLTLMSFAQANFRSNLEFAREYAAVRSIPEVFNVQAAYFKRQMELANKQANELQALTSDMASKKAAQIQNQIKSN